MPRKTRRRDELLEDPVGASMRPRPDAAENASTTTSGALRVDCFNEAAARCRGKRWQGALRRAELVASMRPRPDAAENCLASVSWSLLMTGFNEAAARCRGKRTAGSGTGTCIPMLQ